MNNLNEDGIPVWAASGFCEADKLPILKGENITSADICENALLWALSRTKHRGIARNVFVNGIQVMLSYGFVRTRKRGDVQVPDGEWRFTEEALPLSIEIRKEIEDIVHIDMLKKAEQLLISTKASFWLTNLHVENTAKGQGYPRQVIKKYWPHADFDSLAAVAFELGHYTSTLYILSLAGYEGLQKTFQVEGLTPELRSLTYNNILQFVCDPAGTEKHSLCFQVYQRLLCCRLAKFCPNLINMKELPETLRKIRENRPSYHLSAQYLTGRPRENFNDNDADAFMGRLGCFIYSVHPHSIPARSPLFQRQEVQAKSDYSPEWEKICYVFAHQFVSILEGVVTPIITDEEVRALRDGLAESYV